MGFDMKTQDPAPECPSLTSEKIKQSKKFTMQASFDGDDVIVVKQKERGLNSRKALKEPSEIRGTYKVNPNIQAIKFEDGTIWVCEEFYQEDTTKKLRPIDSSAAASGVVDESDPALRDRAIPRRGPDYD